jgi:probable HAF family extracellular repeat protein
MRFKQSTRIKLGAVLIFPLFTSVAQGVQYTVTDIGAVGGIENGYSAMGLNNQGQVVDGGALVWTPTVPNGATGTTSPIGTLGGSLTSGRAISDSGKVAGYSSRGGGYGDFFVFAFLYDGTMHDINPNTGAGGEAFGVNNTGEAVGYDNLSQQAFLYNGSYHSLPTLGGNFSGAYGMNAGGAVTGYAANIDNFSHAFLWKPNVAHGVTGSIFDLGTLGGLTSQGSAINADGQIAGYARTLSDATHAFLWTPSAPNGTSGNMLDLGTIGGNSFAYGLNSTGEVVGISGTDAFSYTMAGGMVDLNAQIDPLSGWQLGSALAINDFGQIAGFGTLGGQEHAFLLTPVSEPSTLVLAALSGLVLCILARHGRLDTSDSRSRVYDMIAVAVALAVAFCAAISARADSAVACGANDIGQLGDGTYTRRLSPVAVTGLTSGITAIAAGGHHSLAVQNGGAYAWGFGGYGQLGNGTGASSTTPVAVTGLASGVTDIAGGGSHSLAVQNGGVWAWGANTFGQLGDGPTPDSFTPVSVTGLTSGVTAISAGFSHNLAVQNGGVWVWGNNAEGQLGDGTYTNRAIPVSLTGLTSGVTAIAAGHYHSLALQNGAVWAWGENTLGQLGDGTTTFRNTPVQVAGLTSGVTAIACGGYHSLAVQNGGVWAWGDNIAGQLGYGPGNSSTPMQVHPADLRNIVAVAAGYTSSYALSSDGSMWVWGDNSYGELGLGTTQHAYGIPQHLLPPTGYVFTSIGPDSEASHALATLAAIGDFNRDGHVNAADILPMEQALTNAGGYQATHDNLPDWQLSLIGDLNGDGQFNNADLQSLLYLLKTGGGSPTPVPEPSTVLLAALAGLTFYVLARRCRFNIPDSRSRIYYTIALAHAVLFFAATSARADSAVAWGSNSLGELGDGTFTQRRAPVPVSGLASGVTAVVAGNGHSLAIQNGGAWAWGENFSGQLGDGTTTGHSTPAPVSGLTSGVTAISAGWEHSLAIRNGGVFAWGSNNNGQLGDGTTTNCLTPFPVTGLSNGVTAIAAGANHSLAVQNGGVLAWGANYDGQLGDGTTTIRVAPVSVTSLSNGVTAIAAGVTHSLAVQNGGAVAWGANDFGELGDGGAETFSTTHVPVSGLSSGVTAIAAGWSFSLAVQNGSVFAWGTNGAGEVGDGSTTIRRTPVQIDPADLKNIVAVAAGAGSSYALSSDGSLWDWGGNSKGELGLGTLISHYTTPQHLLPPAGYVFTSINGGDGDSTLATLAAIGDFNRDGHVNAADILPMEQGLTDAGNYQAAHDNLPNWQLSLIGDINGDGQFNNADLQGLLYLLKTGSGSPTSVPEPSTILLAALGFATLVSLFFREKARARGVSLRTHVFKFVLTPLVLLLASTSHARAAIQYTITDLGTDSAGVGLGVAAINTNGQVTGSYHVAGDSYSHAYFYDGTIHDLGTFGRASEGHGINANGHVAGFDGYIVAPNQYAFLYNGSKHDIGSAGGTNTAAYGINDNGQVTGFVEQLSGGFHAFLWTPSTPNGATGTIHDIGTLGGFFCGGAGINNIGEVTGASQTAGNTANHAFLWKPNTPAGATGTMHDLGTLGGRDSGGNRINAAGQVAGSASTAASQTHAFLWTPSVPSGTSGAMLDLGTLGGTYSDARSINAAGQVTGYSYLPGDGTTHAFIYTSGGGMVDLNLLIDPVSGWELSDAEGNNDAGQIVGTGLLHGESHSFVLTPVPEPSTFVVAALSLAAIGLWRAKGKLRSLGSSGCRPIIAGAGAPFILLLTFGTANGEVRYIATDLGVLPGGVDSYGQGINAAGQVIGVSSIAGAGYITHAFLYDGQMHDLGTLTGQYSNGYGINDAGHVVGDSWGDQGNVISAFLWDGSMHDIGSLDAAGSTIAQAINSSGEVTGQTSVAPAPTAHAFLWKPVAPNGSAGAMHDLGSLGGTRSDGFSINAFGQVAGFSEIQVTSNVRHAFLWTPTTAGGTTGSMIDLETLGGTGSQAFGINDHGAVTGVAATTDGSSHAFIWTPTVSNGSVGAMHDLGTLGGSGSTGSDINNLGQTVGYSTIEDNLATHAFLYSNSEGMMDLNSLIDPMSGWVLYSAQGINDAGQITGYGIIHNQEDAFLLTPVPEPSAGILLAIGAAGCIYWNGRARLHARSCSLVGRRILGEPSCQTRREF